jgi:hypothetical protein
LVVGDHIFAIEVEICPGIYGKVGKKILLVDIDTAKPISPGYFGDPVDLTYPVFIRQGQREMMETAFLVTSR